MESPGNQIPQPPPEQKPLRKRKRIVISCTECHRRKQKCDRASPCSNCVARNKEDLCHYENESARKAQLLEEGSGNREDGGFYRVIRPVESDESAQIGAFGYTKTNGNNNTTLGIFKKIENYGAGTDALLNSPTSSAGVSNGIKEKYKAFVRQLPTKQHVEKLLVTYFKESNYQYYPLDEGIFRDQLKTWYSMASFQTLNQGPSELPADIQAFPALLFQTLALALQFQPPDYDPALDALKYAGEMTFDDLASDYSESGCQILNLLGKRHTTLVTVQTGFLRVSYLKNCGLVPESWHSLSQTIRDAQEIGLHKDVPDTQYRRPDDNPGDVLESLWMQQLRRRMWLILSLWDIHMGIILGRPTSIDTRDSRPPFPIDAPIPKNRREEAPEKRSDSDPPTPLSMLLWTAEVGAPLWSIYNLEKQDPYQSNFEEVKVMHNNIDHITRQCPAFFRIQNPDTSFDHLEECHWLPRARAYFQGNTAFSIMALHRPYIFTNAVSRTSALKAGIDLLRSQRALFNLLNAKHYKMFSLVLHTFDAIVLVAAIYILHPSENPDDLDDTLQHVVWGMERFQTMSERNSMAKSGLGVLKAIYVRLKRALNQTTKNTPFPGSSGVGTPTQTSTPNPATHLLPPSTTNESISGTPSTSNNATDQQSNGHHSSISTSSSHQSQQPPQPYNIPTISNITASSHPPLQQSTGWESYTTQGLPLTPGVNFDLSSLPLLQPMHDLVYNDLGGIVGGGSGVDYTSAGNGTSNGLLLPGMDAHWQFEGAFTNDSFWGFMNNYDPAQV